MIESGARVGVGSRVAVAVSEGGSGEFVSVAVKAPPDANVPS